MFFFDLGALLAKILLSLKIKDANTLGIGKDFVEFAKKLGVDQYDERRLTRTFEDIGDKFSKSCQQYVERSIHDKERQKVIVDLVIASLQDIRIDSELMISVRRDVNSLTRVLVEENSKNIEVDGLDTQERELFDSLLHHSATIIINCFNQMPEMSTARAKYLMARVDSILEIVDAILDKLKSIDEKINNLPEKYQSFEAQYRRNLISNYNYIRLYGVDDIGEQMKKYKLSTAYVQLRVEVYDRMEMATPAISIQDLFDQKRKNIWISGEAGSGKTTCLSWLAIQAASDAKMPGLVDVIPVIVELRSLNFEKLSFIDCINRVMLNSSYSIPSGWLEDRINKGKLLILLDGFDEISESDRSKVFDWIHDIDSKDLCRKVFTSRPQVKNRPQGIMFTEVKMLAMKMPQIEEFVVYWHNAVLREKLLCPEDSVITSQKNLLELLKKNEALRRLSENPLLCAMISALHSKNSTIPTNKRELYEACCKMLLEGRDTAAGVTANTIELSYEVKKRIMSKLAYQMMRNARNQMEEDKETVISVLKNTMEDMSLTMYDPSSLLDYFIDRTGIIQEPGKDRISFVHKSFEEYLCAIEMFRQQDWTYAEEKIMNDNWMETICILIGLGNRENADKIITETLQRGENYNESEKSVFYALEYLSGAIDVNPLLRENVQTRMKQFIPPKRDQIDPLAKAGEMVIPYLRKKRNYSVTSRFCCLSVLQRIGTISALKYAIEYFDSKTTPIELQIIGELINLIPKEYLIEERIPEAIVSYYVKFAGEVLDIPMGFVRCLNLCNDDLLKVMSGLKRDAMVWTGMNTSSFYVMEELIKGGPYLDLERMKLYTIPDSIAQSIRYLEVHGDFLQPMLLHNFTNLLTVHIHSTATNFDVDSINKIENLFGIHKWTISFENAAPSIDGERLLFLRNSRELCLKFYGECNQVSFKSFYRLRNIEKLTIVAPNAHQFDYREMCTMYSLKELVVIASSTDSIESKLPNHDFVVTQKKYVDTYSSIHQRSNHKSSASDAK